jgi:single-strand DNA-binding protein
MSVNKVILLGNLGADVAMRYMPDGTATATVNIATTDKYKDKAGNKQEKTEWHRVVFFGKLAEIVGEYLKKGSSIYVEGKQRTRKWTDKAGVERYTTEVYATTLDMQGKKDSGAIQPAPTGEAEEAPANFDGFDIPSDDIPF